MISLEYGLLGTGLVMFVFAAETLAREAHDLFASWQDSSGSGLDALPPKAKAVLPWRIPLALVMVAWAPLLLLAGMIIAIGRISRM